MSKKTTTEPKQHSLVPTHEKLNDKEKLAVLDQYEIKVNQLPIIFVDDPAIKNLDAQPGDVIKVTRDSKTAGVSVFYRGVANG